jgi:predicted metal-dependent peptidase
MRMETTQEMHTRLRKEFGFENYSWKDKKSVLPAKFALTERHKDEVSELIGNIIFSAFHGQESYQFVAHILSVFNRNVDDKLQAAAAVSMNSTYFDLWINPYMMFALTDNIEEIMSVMEHEVAYILYRHIPRAKDYMKSSNVEPLNWAMDCSINQQIPKIPNWTISLKTIEDIVWKYGHTNICQFFLNLEHLLLVEGNHPESKLSPFR